MRCRSLRIGRCRLRTRARCSGGVDDAVNALWCRRGRPRRGLCLEIVLGGYSRHGEDGGVGIILAGRGALQSLGRMLSRPGKVFRGVESGRRAGGGARVRWKVEWVRRCWCRCHCPRQLRIQQKVSFAVAIATAISIPHPLCKSRPLAILPRPSLLCLPAGRFDRPPRTSLFRCGRSRDVLR